MDIYDFTCQRRGRVIGGKKTRQHHQINGIACQHTVNSGIERRYILIFLAWHHRSVQPVSLCPHQAICLALTTDYHGNTGTQAPCRNGLLEIFQGTAAPREEHGKSEDTRHSLPSHYVRDDKVGDWEDS